MFFWMEKNKSRLHKQTTEDRIMKLFQWMRDTLEYALKHKTYD